MVLVSKRGVLVAFLIALSSATTFGTGGRKQLWNFDLLKLIDQAGDPEAEHVWGLAFSPDETRLAIGFGEQGDAGGGHVVVVAVDPPKAVIRRFDLDFDAVSESWSPSGKLLAVGRRVFSLEGDGTCRVPADFNDAVGFLADDRIVVYRQGNASKRGPEGATEIQVLRPDCSVEGDWHLAEGLSHVLGTCPEADLIAVWAIPGFPRSGPTETSLVKYPGHETTNVQTWEEGAFTGGLILADSCKAICAGEGYKNYKSFHAACWNTHTGAQILEDAKLTLATGTQAFNGSGGDLLAVTVYHTKCLESKFWQFLDLDGCVSRPTRRVLWNIKTGQEVLSWPVLIQHYVWHLRGGDDRKLSDPFALGISTTGRYLAEGGAGRVQLYVVQ